MLSLGAAAARPTASASSIFFHKALTRLGKKIERSGERFGFSHDILSVGWALLGLSACAGSIFFSSQGAGAPCEGKKISPSGERFGLSHDMLSLGAAAAGPTASAPSIFFSQGADAPWKKKSSGRESVSIPPYNSFSLAFRKNSAKSMVKGSAKNVYFWHKV